MTQVPGVMVELDSTIISASTPESVNHLNEFSSPAALLLQHQPDADNEDTVTFQEDEPWDQETAKMVLIFSRAAWESQGSPKNLYVSMMTLQATLPDKKEN